MLKIEGTTDATGLRIAIVVSRYNDFVTNRLRDGAVEALTLAGARQDDLTLVAVPGTFEVPLAAQWLAESGRYDAVVCLGCVIRGETAHHQYIASAVSDRLSALATSCRVPVAFGILTTESVEQALERAGPRSANKGWEAAMAAVEMATLLKRLAAGLPARRDA